MVGHDRQFNGKISSVCSGVRKAKSMLGLIRKRMENETASIMLPRYKSMARPVILCIILVAQSLKEDQRVAKGRTRTNEQI